MDTESQKCFQNNHNTSISIPVATGSGDEGMAMLTSMFAPCTALAKAPVNRKWQDLLNAGRHQDCSHTKYHNACATWRSCRQPTCHHGHSPTRLELFTRGCLAQREPAPACSQPAGKLAGQPQRSLGMLLSSSQLSLGGWLDLAASGMEGRLK